MHKPRNLEILGVAAVALLAAVVAISPQFFYWLLFFAGLLGVVYLIYLRREKMLFQVTDKLFKAYYLAAFLIVSSIVVAVAIFVIKDVFTSWIAIVGYLLLMPVALVYIGRAQIGATFIGEPSAMVFQRGGMFLRIGWVKKGHIMLTNQAVQRLNALALLFTRRVSDEDERLFVRWFMYLLRDALDTRANLTRGWEIVCTHGANPGERPDNAPIALSNRDDVYRMILHQLRFKKSDPCADLEEIVDEPPYARPWFSRLEQRPADEVEVILDAISVISTGSLVRFQINAALLNEHEKKMGTLVEGGKCEFNLRFPVGYVEQYSQYDILTRAEIARETGLTPGMLNWCLADVPGEQKPRLGLFGGLRVIGFPWDSIKKHRLQVETWTEDPTSETGYKVIKETWESQEIGLGRQQFKIYVKRAETADGFAVDYFIVLYLHLRNVYKALVDVDNWQQWLANTVVAKIRELTRRLPLLAAIDAKEQISRCIIEGVHGEDYTLVPELLVQATDKVSDEAEQKAGRPRYRIHVVPMARLRLIEQALYGATQADGAAVLEDSEGTGPETLLQGILLRGGIVVDNMGVKDVIPSDAEAKGFIEALPGAIQAAQVRIHQGIGEAGRIRREIEALACEGDKLADIFRQIEMTKSVPSGSTVVLGGGGSQTIDYALLAQLLRQRTEKPAGGDAGATRESGKRSGRSRTPRKRS